MDSDRISRVPPYSGYRPLEIRYVYGIITLFDLSFQTVPLPIPRLCLSYNPKIAATTLVWALSISLATTLEITIVFSSSAYLDVSVQRVCPDCSVIVLHTTGLPHSDIIGSIVICTSPILFAAYHVLLRL